MITKAIFASVIEKFARIKLFPHYKDDCWNIDLSDRSSSGNYNTNINFTFTMNDNYTKYACAIPIKDKSGKRTTTAFKKLIKTSKRKPQKLWSDRCKEFYKKHFWIFLTKMKYKFIQLIRDLKAGFVERFNGIILDRRKDPMYIEGKACWLNHLDAALETSNNRVHRAIHMTPFEAKIKLTPNVIPSGN